MGFIHLTAKTLNEDAIALIDWDWRSKGKSPSIRVTLLAHAGFLDDKGIGQISAVHLYFPVAGKDAEILRSHFGLPYQPEEDGDRSLDSLDKDSSDGLPISQNDKQELMAVTPSSDDDLNPEIPF